MVHSVQSAKVPMANTAKLKLADRRWLAQIAALMFHLRSKKESDPALPHFMVQVYWFSDAARDYYLEQITKHVIAAAPVKKKRGPGRPRKAK